MVEGHTRKSHQHRQDLAGEYKWGDTGQMLFLLIFIIGTIADFFIFNISKSYQHIIPWYYRLAIFIPLIIIAIYTIQKSHQQIFREQRKKLMVITTGIYGKIRHPMYTGSLIIYLAFVILTLSIIALIIFILVSIFFYYLCQYEEQILIEKLGDEYKHYMKTVPMILPKIRK